MRTADAAGGAFLLFLSLLMIFVVIPAEIMEGTTFGLPPGFFPTLVASAMALASAGLLAKAILKPADYAGEPVPLTVREVGMFLIVVAIVVAGVLVTDRFGFLVGGPATIAAVALFMGERNAVALALTAVVPVVVVHLLVTRVLGSPLP